MKLTQIKAVELAYELLPESFKINELIDKTRYLYGNYITDGNISRHLRTLNCDNKIFYIYKDKKYNKIKSGLYPLFDKLTVNNIQK